MTSPDPATPAPSPLLRPRAARLRRRLHRLLEPFWVVPALWSAGAVVVGLALPHLDLSGGEEHLPLLFDGGVESARSVLSTIAGAMISVTGLVFSITIVVLQLASSQFSPRVLATFLEDRLTQHTLGVFAASFLFALSVLRSIGDAGDRSGVPQVAVTLAFLFVLGAVAMFLAFIHHITQSISVATVIQRVGHQTRGLLERSERRREQLPATMPDLPTVSGQTVLTSPHSGYLDRLDPGSLCATAVTHDVRIEVLHPLGTFVARGAPIALVRGADADAEWTDEVWADLVVRRERSMDQDVTFGLRRLVDIAERALSPGVNDPTTAVQAIDELHDLLRRVVVEPAVVGVYVDADETPRVLTAEHTVAGLLDLAVDEIAHYGRDSLQIPARLEAMLVDLEVAAAPEHREVVRAKRVAVPGSARVS